MFTLDYFTSKNGNMIEYINPRKVNKIIPFPNPPRHFDTNKKQIGLDGPKISFFHLHFSEIITLCRYNKKGGSKIGTVTVNE